MDLRTYLGALRRSWLLIVAATLFGTGLAAVLCQATPKTYASTVDFYISTPRVLGASAQSGGQFAESRVDSYIVLLSSEQLAKRVVASTGVDLTPLQLARRVSATSEVNTVIVRATVHDQSPARALTIAQGLAADFGRLVDDLDNQGSGGASVAINVVSGPTLLSGPVSPSWLRYLALGLGAGLALGVLAALLRQVLDTSVHDEETAQRVTGVPVIGTIGHHPETKQAPLIVGAEAGSIRAEAYRQLRTNLQFISATRSAEVVQITSSLPLEGKSTSAVNLALAFVELGARVLVIEGDLRRPRVATYLDLPREVGLTNVLAGQVSVDEVLQPWGQEGLQLLASGPTPPNPSELLGSPQMAALVETLRSRFDLVLLDTPPVLPVTDAVVASSLADAVVLVVRHGRTSRAQVTAAARALAAVNAPLVGVVLTMKKQSRGERHAYGTEAYTDESIRTARPQSDPSAPLPATPGAVGQPVQQPVRESRH